jgi:hypothetical protein
LEELKGGALWGELLSYPNLLNQEGMFELLCGSEDPGGEDEHEMDVNEIISQLGICTPETLETTLSRMCLEDLQLLRQDLLQQISLNSLGATLSVSAEHERFDQIHSEDYLAVVNFLSKSSHLTTVAALFTCQVVSTALTNILGTKSQYSLRIPNILTLHSTIPPSLDSHREEDDQQVERGDLLVSGLSSVLHSPLPRHSFTTGLQRESDSPVRYLSSTDGSSLASNPRQQVVHTIQLSLLSDSGTLSNQHTISGALSLHSQTSPGKEESILLLPPKLATQPQPQSPPQHQKVERMAPHRVNIITPDIAMRFTNTQPKEFPQRPVTQHIRRHVGETARQVLDQEPAATDIPVTKSTIEPQEPSLNDDSQIAIHGLGYSPLHQQPDKAINFSRLGMARREGKGAATQDPIGLSGVPAVITVRPPLVHPQSTDTVAIPNPTLCRPLELNPNFSFLLQRPTQPAIKPSRTLIHPAPSLIEFSDFHDLHHTAPPPHLPPPHTDLLDDFFRKSNQFVPQSKTLAAPPLVGTVKKSSSAGTGAGGGVMTVKKPLTASRILRSSLLNDSSHDVEITIATSVHISPRPPTQQRRSHKGSVPQRTIKSAQS